MFAYSDPQVLMIEEHLGYIKKYMFVDVLILWFFDTWEQIIENIQVLETLCYFNSFAMSMTTKKHWIYHKSIEIIRYFDNLWNANVLLLRKTHCFMLLTGIFYKKTHLQTNYTLHTKYSQSRNDAFYIGFIDTL